MTAMVDWMKRAININIKPATSTDITQGTLQASKKSEKLSYYVKGKIPAQSRRRVLQLLPLATARVWEDSFECPKEDIRNKPN